MTDSLLLSVSLYRITGEDRYRVSARRIWANGLQFCQRGNGGAGTDKCVTPTQPILRISGYEASQCCTMRYAEALLCFHRNRELFGYDPFAPVVTEPDGRRYYYEPDPFRVQDRCRSGHPIGAPAFDAKGPSLCVEITVGLTS